MLSARICFHSYFNLSHPGVSSRVFQKSGLSFCLVTPSPGSGSPRHTSQKVPPESLPRTVRTIPSLCLVNSENDPCPPLPSRPSCSGLFFITLNNPHLFSVSFYSSPRLSGVSGLGGWRGQWRKGGWWMPCVSWPFPSNRMKKKASHLFQLPCKPRLQSFLPKLLSWLAHLT